MPEEIDSINRWSICGRYRGQAMVEAALTMLVFFVCLFAIFEGGRLIQTQHALTDAAREGARRSIAPMTQTSDLPTYADVQGVVQGYLQSAHLNPALATISVDQSASSGIVGDTTEYSRVTVTYPYNIMTLGMFGLLNLTLTGESLMRNETSP